MRFSLARVLYASFGLCILAICLPAIAQQKTEPGKSRNPVQQRRATAAAAVAAPTAKSASRIDPLDWPNWRGPEQNGISRETGLVDRWSPSGENVLWKRTDLGTRSTPIVMRGKLYVLCRSEPGTKKEGEKVVCVDAATGKTVWEHPFNVFLTDVPDTRVGWSSVVGDPDTGHVYAQGVCGYFLCLDGETGKTIWSRSMSEEFGLLSTYGGRTNVPVVFENLVLISGVVIGWGDMAVPAHRFLAFDKRTGEVVWFNGTQLRPDDTTYSTPTLAVLGKAALVFGSGDGGVWAFEPRTGRPIWKYQLSIRGLNVSPLVEGDTVYMGQSEENTEALTQGAVAAIKGLGSNDITQTGTIWQTKELMVGKSSPVLVDGRLYAADDSGSLHILDASTGEELGRPVRLVGTILRASPLYADGKLYLSTTSAWHVLAPTEQGAKIVHRMRLAEGEEVHGSPIASHGRIYYPTTLCLYCLGKPDAKSSAAERPAMPQEQALGSNTQPAHVQVVPAESLIKPGESIQYKVRLFNDRGQLLKEQAATFAVDAGGTIDSNGRFASESVPSLRAAIVSAKVGALTGKARVRIVPPLPWKFDFDDVKLATAPNSKVQEGEPPLPWIGIRYRHKIREVDGNKVMVKITTIPKGTRSQGWIGPPDLHDYTVQADVRGGIRDSKLPDIGLIAQRYTLDLMGAEQQLQIRTWTSMLSRFSKNTPVVWKPDTWYTLKFRASVEDGHAVLRGKVWPKGEKEPDSWTVEAVDEAGNLVGSPGLFGNATNAEIYYDNISVTPN